MAENKQSFVLYADQYELFKKLPNEVAGELIKHIFAYVNDEYPTTDNLLIEIAFEPIKAQLKRDLKRWESKVEARSRAGKASAEAKKANKEQQTSTHSTYVDFVQQTSTKSTDNVNVNVNVNDNVNEYNKELVSETSSPTKKPKSKKRKEVDLSQYTDEQQSKFNGLEKWIEENAYNLRTIPEQLNIDEFYRLFKDGYTWSEISKVLLEMHNRPEYCQPKKTFSVNLTARNWMDSNRKRDKEQQQKSFKNQTNEKQYTPRISKSEWESKTGRKYEGQDDPNA